MRCLVLLAFLCGSIHAVDGQSDFQLLAANNYLSLNVPVAIEAVNFESYEIIKGPFPLTVAFQLIEDNVPGEAYLKVGAAYRVFDQEASFVDAVGMSVELLIQLQLHDVQQLELAQLPEQEADRRLIEIVRESVDRSFLYPSLRLNLPANFSGIYATDRQQTAEVIPLVEAVTNKPAKDFIHAQFGDEMQQEYERLFQTEIPARWIDDSTHTFVQQQQIADTDFHLLTVTSGTGCGDDLGVFSYSLIQQTGDEIKEIAVFDEAITHVFQLAEGWLLYSENELSHHLAYFAEGELTQMDRRTIFSFACGC